MEICWARLSFGLQTCFLTSCAAAIPWSGIRVEIDNATKFFAIWLQTPADVWMGRSDNHLLIVPWLLPLRSACTVAGVVAASI